MGFEWDKITRWILFAAGLISGAMAGYLFYIGKNSTGAAYMAMTVGFLCFATRTGIFRADKHKNNNINDENKKFREIALMIAEIYILSLKNIGRTIPPSSKELQEIEEDLKNFMQNMNINNDETEIILNEFDKLKNRSRLSDGGRAFLKNARL